MGGKDSGKKWRRKIVQPQLDNLWNLLFPMTKEGRKEIREKEKDKAQNRKERLKEVRRATNG